jgi:predicted Zn-dependent protease with MMP-like domain
VERALNDLPPPFAERVANVDILIERRPSEEDLRAAGLGPGETLFGLYEGIPLTERTSDYGLVLPDRITLFQEPLEDVCGTEDELADEIRITVIHEIAHFFGIDDERLHELGVD